MRVMRIATRRSPALETVSLYVSGLAARVDDLDLVEHFKGEGKVRHLGCARNRSERRVLRRV